MSVKDEVLARAAALGVPFELHEHEQVHTMEECLAFPWAGGDLTFCKNILLCNRQQTAFYLYVTPPDKHFRTADVSKALGVSRLSFAPEGRMLSLLRTPSGSLSPFAMWFDEGRAVRLVLDRDIRREGRIAFHPCDSTATMVFAQDDFFARVLSRLARDPVWLSVPWPEA